jgi:aminoglycoside phosphotransferase (APT) family kinase protein
MVDPKAARVAQLRDIQNKTGKTIADLHAVLAASGLGKTGERRADFDATLKGWIKQAFDAAG